MAPIRPGENATNTSSSGSANGVVKRRNRIPLSCESCRSRKLKCDRQKPCQNCKARDQANGCIYAADEGKANRGGQLVNLSSDMRDRVHKLESLVNSMLTAQQATSAAELSEAPAANRLPSEATSIDANAYPVSNGSIPHNGPYAAMVGDANGQQFLGPSHWEAVLRDISAIRESIEESSYKLRAPVTMDLDRPSMLRGLPPITNKSELIQSLPNKTLAEHLHTRFWEYVDPSMPPILHKPTFKVRMDEAYQNLEAVSLPRLAMLFTLFAVALQSYETNGPAPPDLRGYLPDLPNNYRQYAAQCLMTADVASPEPDSVVAFQFYWIAEFYRCPKAVAGLWMLQSMVIRKAMLMGYHRDPSCFSEISVFEGEMRRRSWHALCQSDILLSFHLGMPPMIDYSQSDVQAPRCVYEENLYETMSELPAERPKNEKTPVAYYISKVRLFQTFSAIVRAINSIYAPSDANIAELNAQLIAAYDDIHPHLRDETPEETNVHRIQRLCIASVYHKSICVLNRRTLFVNERTSVQEQSRDLCIKSACGMLTIQDIMHRAGDRWWDWIFVRNDFLLATVLVCMILYTFKKYAKSDSNMFDLPSEAEESIYRQSLLRAKDIWATLVDVIPEARKAYNIIETTLYQTGDHKSAVGADSVESAVYSALSAEGLPTPEFAPINSAIDFDNVDWGSWDKMLQATALDTMMMPEPMMSQNYFGVVGPAQV